MRVLIVGCGYVGLPLGAELVRQGHEVYGLRRSLTAVPELCSAGLKPVVADITRRDDLLALNGRFDWVMNTVSSTHGGPQEYRAVYLDGTRNLVAWLQSAPPVRFVYTSSTGVYGQEDGSLVDESSLTAPTAETSRVLVETEQVLQRAAKEHAFPAVILRVAGIYGPDRGFLFKQFLRGDFKLADEGQRIANMIHRDDVIGCIMATLQHGRAGEVYNAVDDEPVTQLEFFRWVSAALGRPMPPLAPAGEAVDRKRGVTNKRVSNRKLKTELGYRFKFPTFREGYATAVAEQRSPLPE